MTMAKSDEGNLDLCSSDVASCKGSSVEERKQELWEDKIFKKGIIYLSFIPPGMTIQVLTQLLSKYGQIGRVMLQPSKTVKDKKDKKRGKNNKCRNFKEGWVEFLKKKCAKQVAAALNNSQIGGKKRSQYHDYLWNIKYLSRFKWVHLSERITYERAVYKQRLHTEINQAKKVASHFKDKVESADRREQIEKRKKKTDSKDNVEITTGEKDWSLSSLFKQKETDAEKISKKKKKNVNREDFLKNLFS